MKIVDHVMKTNYKTNSIAKSHSSTERIYQTNLTLGINLSKNQCINHLFSV